MSSLSHHDMITVLIAISIMLIFGRFLAEVARKLHQPIVVGEILAGILLGPTVLGMISFDTFEMLFPTTGNASIALDGIISISVILLLFIAGLEVELNIVVKQGKEALYISFFSMIIPFAFGFIFPWFFPEIFGIDESSKLIFSLFIGTSLSITALPVIARILIDLNLFRTKMGTLIIASAMVNDLLGWIIFSIILSMMGTKTEGFGLIQTIILTVGFTVLVLTLGKYLLNKLIPWINNRFAWPGGILSIAIAGAFLGAAFTEYIGIHAIFGAFIVGVAFGDSANFSSKVKEIIHQFVTNIFAPLFFVSIGLSVNFAVNFDLLIVVVILILAFLGKIIGSGIGARLGGFSKNESLATGFGMNARGAMEIILGLLALEAQLINNVVFVALVIMALLTSMSSGPLMKYFLKKEADLLSKQNN